MTSQQRAVRGAPQRRIIIHGHFYQPPREDPWLEEIPEQRGAAPWHDWNEKIERECYRAVVAARVLDADGRIARVMNTLAWLSYDVGPTLCEWMEREAPATYAAIIAADRLSIARTGHGNAIAQPYHHVILPLASRRDKVTEVRWGVADFTRRFGRPPEGMWLPETAVDDETLDVLAQEGIRFTILAPSQVRTTPPLGAMGTYTTEHGRSIAIGVYDGDLSHGVAFGRLLTNARVWQAELLRGLGAGPADVRAIATDGETYGHHHHFSEMALAWVLDDLDRRPEVSVTNFAALLDAHGAAHPVALVAPSSWSCEHGVERWRANCGCRVAHEHPPRQEWRGPLRTALESLRAALDARVDAEAPALFRDPAAARDAYGSVVSASAPERDAHTAAQLRPGLTDAQVIRARELLELTRDGLRMFTSCAWFFDDLTGLEPAQNLQYAARALEFAGDDDGALEHAFARGLRTSRSSAEGSITAEEVWAADVRPAIAPRVRIAAGAAAAAQCVPGWTLPPTPAFEVHVRGDRVTLTYLRTRREYHYHVRVALRGLGDVVAYVRPVPPGGDGTALPRGTIPVAMADFPERERTAVRDAVRVPQRRRLVDLLLDRETQQAVARGDTTLDTAAAGALAAEVDALADDATDARVERACGLVDLLELLGRDPPFDVQTAFARLLAHAPSDARARFAGLASRLRFAPAVLGATPDAARDAVASA